jgi:hypothetical protein
MSSAYFASLVLLPVIITEPGRYRTRKGEIVTVERATRFHTFGCGGRYADDTVERWHKSGRLYAGRTCENDIVDVSEVAA